MFWQNRFGDEEKPFLGKEPMFYVVLCFLVCFTVCVAEKPAGFPGDCCFWVMLSKRLTKLFHRNIKNAVTAAASKVAHEYCPNTWAIMHRQGPSGSGGGWLWPQGDQKELDVQTLSVRFTSNLWSQTVAATRLFLSFFSHIAQRDRNFKSQNETHVENEALYCCSMLLTWQRA